MQYIYRYLDTLPKIARFSMQQKFYKIRLAKTRKSIFQYIDIAQEIFIGHEIFGQKQIWRVFFYVQFFFLSIFTRLTFQSKSVQVRIANSSNVDCHHLYKNFQFQH